MSRTALNGGMGAGALIGGVLVTGKGTDYTALVLANAASFVLAALLFVFLRARSGAAPPRDSADVDTHTTRRAARRPATTVVIAGTACYAAAFAMLIPSGRLTLGALVALLVTVTVVFTLGELLVSVASADLVLALAPEGRRGAYLSVSHAFLGAGSALAPGVLTGVLDLGGGPALWGVTLGTAAVLIGVVGALRRPVAARLARTREPVA